MRLSDATKVINMPKLLSPFEREEINGNYVCAPKIVKEFRWVFSSESTAVEKLDGTSVSVVVRGHRITEIYNRDNRIEVFSRNGKRFAEGILEAIDKEYFNPKEAGEGQYFGELIGEKVNANPYKLKGHLWLPFSGLREKCCFHFWRDFVKTLEGLSDKEIFNEMNELMKGLWSVYKRRLGFEMKPVNESTGFDGMAAEGIVFYRKDHEIKPATINGKKTVAEMCKLRRDMFSFFAGDSHHQRDSKNKK